MTTPRRKLPVHKGPGKLHLSAACFLPENPDDRWGLVFTTPEGQVWIDVTGHDLVDGDQWESRRQKRYIEIRGFGAGTLLAEPGNFVFVTIGYDLYARKGMLYVVDGPETSIVSDRVYQRQVNDQEYPYLVYRNPVQDVPGEISLTQCDGDGNPVEQARRLSLVSAAFHRIYKFLCWR